MFECFNEDGTNFHVVASVDEKFKLFQTITEPFVRNNFDPDLDFFFKRNELRFYILLSVDEISGIKIISEL